MKTGILITARLGSTRLEKKHLREINGQPIILFLLERIIFEFREEILNNQAVVIIASSDEPDNREFEGIAGSFAEVYYGAVSNIPLRHHQTAVHYGLDHIIAVDGDDILCSVSGMRAIYSALRSGEAYVKTSGLPFGMNAMGYSTLFLEGCLAASNQDVLETGWGRVFGDSFCRDIRFAVTSDERLRFTLDYEEDLNFFREVLLSFGSRIVETGDEEIIQAVLSHCLYKLNESVNEEYWQNFYTNIAKEGKVIES